MLVTSLLYTILYYLSLITIISCDLQDYTYYSNVDKYYKFHKTPLVWYNAVRECRKEGATLAMPKNYEEACVLKDIFSNFPASHLTAAGVPWADFMFLGFHDAFLEGEFITELDECPISKMYHTWEPNQPDDFLWAEDCGTLHRNGGINDFSCAITLVFICQKDGHPKPVSNENAYFYSFENNKRYHLYNEPKKWSEAMYICNGEGSVLANMNSDNAKKIMDNALKLVPQDYTHQNFERSIIHLPTHECTYQGKYLISTGGLQENTIKNQIAKMYGNEDDCTIKIQNEVLTIIGSNPKAKFFCEQEIESDTSGMLDLRMSDDKQ